MSLWISLFVDFIVVFLAISMVLTSPVTTANACKVLEYLDCIQNKTMTGHVIKTSKIPVPALVMCQIQCFEEDQCVSYNLGPVDGVIRTCELSAADHWTNVTALVNKSGFEYCPIKNHCSSSPCPKNKPYCFPDFENDAYSCQEGMWTSWSAWSNCPTSRRTRVCISKSIQNPDCGLGPSNETKQLDPSNYPNPIPAACSIALGMSKGGRIQDSQITSSGDHSFNYCRASIGRLYRQFTPSIDLDGGWCASANEPGVAYLQVDLLKVTTITRIATQGRYINHSAKQYVKTYNVGYSNDGANWVLYKALNESNTKIFPANNDTTSVVTNDFTPPIVARYVRVYPLTYNNHMSMRMELYGY